VFKGYDACEFTKTTSRSLLGNMNDLVDLYRHHLLYDGGFNYVNSGEVIMRINRTPQGNLGWSNSSKIVKELLGRCAEKNA
jgi:hypothetical protein